MAARKKTTRSKGATKRAGGRGQDRARVPPRAVDAVSPGSGSAAPDIVVPAKILTAEADSVDAASSAAAAPSTPERRPSRASASTTTATAPSPGGAAPTTQPASALPAPHRGLVAFVALGMGIGVIWHVLLFGLDVWLHQSAEYMGVAAEDVTSRLTELFADEIRAQQLGLLGEVALLGTLPGLVAGLALHAVTTHFRRTLTRRARVAWLAAIVVWLHAWLLITSIAAYPAVYAPGAAQSTWMALSVALAVDIVPDALSRAFLWTPVAVVLVFWGRLGIRFVVQRITRLPERRQAPTAALGGLGLGLVVGLVALLSRAPSADLHAYPGRPPNVLIVAVDSLRADALAPDHPRDIAPNVRALAARSMHFSRAIPTVPRTYPSWASMLTGMYPHHHGIRHMFPAPPTGRRIVIPHTLPTIMGAAGYRTGVFSDFAGDVFTRADFGFETVDAPEFTLPSNVALGGLKLHLHFMPWFIDVFGARTHPELMAFERLADPTLVRDRFYRWLARDDGRPFMAAVFLSAGHFPFAAPEPHSSRFVTGDYDGPSRFLKSHFGAELNDASAKAETDHLRALHEGAIHASDAAIGDILRDLGDAGILDNTIIIVTADHGEGLYEHGLGTGHGDHLYGRATMEVPLIIAAPGGKARPMRHDMPVSLADLTPTVLGLLGLHSTAPAGTVAGVDLVHAPVAELAARPVFSEIDLWFFPPETHRLDGKRIVATEGFDGFDYDDETGQIFLAREWEDAAIAAKHRVVFAGDRKLVYVPTRERVGLELYDPIEDPGDLTDLAADEPETRDRLAAHLYAWMLLDPNVEAIHGWVLPRRAADASR